MGLRKYLLGFGIESKKYRKKRFEEREGKIGEFAMNSLDELMSFIRPNEKEELNYSFHTKRILEEERERFKVLKESLSNSNNFKFYKKGYLQGYPKGFKENDFIEKKFYQEQGIRNIK